MQQNYRIYYLRAMAKWLVKSEPNAYSFQQFAKEATTSWTGVRNAAARLHMLAMQQGDDVLYYHSGDEKAVVGLAKVISKQASPDPTSTDPRWVAVELEAVVAFPKPVTLKEIKATEALEGLALIKNTRLSVMPVSEAHFQLIVKMASQ